MEIIVLPRAKRSLKKLENKVAVLLLSSFIHDAKTSDILQSTKVCKIIGTSFYRYKSKSYRIIFDVEGRIVSVYDIRKRNESTYKIDF